MLQPNDALQLLRDRKLPQMVRWYNPRLLTRIGIRTLVSNVFGQYADQRLIQAATDPADDDTLLTRYDYRDPTPVHPLDRVTLDDTGAFHIDYIADTGDGFDSTYTMAYLMAVDKLKVPGITDPLPAGDTLIMGGDQCYPQATREEYKHRLVDPMSWAYNASKPERKLFAIPGNHDWYDGLNAFDSLFCAGRDRLTESNASRLGGWQCQQHRSYWALRLPYNWWIWGTDIQFSKYLDTPQINYFELMASQMQTGDNLIICISEPAWLIADLKGTDEEENFFKITTIARNRGARVVAVLAGDWHHYNRYYSSELDVHFLTAGGGGSFLHPTHVLKDSISVSWPQRDGLADENAIKPTDASSDGSWHHKNVDLSLRKKKTDATSTAGQVAGSVKDAVGDVIENVIEPVEDAARGKKRVKRTRLLRSEAPTCYPPRLTSRLLSLKNLLFPIYNLPFALGIGFIYWLLTWEFYSIVERHDISAGKIDAVGVHSGYLDTLQYLPLYLMQACLVSIPLTGMIALLCTTIIWYVAAPEKPKWKRWLTKLGFGVPHLMAHLFAMFALGLAFVMVNNAVAPRVEPYINSLWKSSNKDAGVVSRTIKEALEPLSSNRAEQRGMFGDSDRPGEQGRAPPPASAMPGADTQAPGTVVKKDIRRIVGFVLYPLQMIVLGGFVGGFLWGLYWVITSVFFRTHGEDAFAALRIKHYRNFLRMKFERDTLTIYPIGVDRIPHRSFWRARKPGSSLSHNPVLEATGHIDVRLIEKPIVIKARPHEDGDEDGSNIGGGGGRHVG